MANFGFTLREQKRSRTTSAMAATACVLLVGALLSGASAANAAESPVNELTSTQETELRGYFAQYGVDAEVQSRLIKQFEAGEPWLSFTDGAQASSVAHYDTAKSNVTVSTYEDGSISVSQVEKPSVVTTTDQSQSLAAWGCTYVSAGSYGGYWKSCDVTVNLGIISQGFYLDYENIQGSGAKITRYWGHHHHIVGGALSGHRLERFSNTQVRYSADLSVAWQGFPVGWTSWMQANQSGNLISTTHN